MTFNNVINQIDVFDFGTGETTELRAPNVFEYDSNTVAILYRVAKTKINWRTAPKNDLNNWTEQGTVLEASNPSFTDSQIGSGGTTVKVGATWYLFFCSFQGKIWYATGSDINSMTIQGIAINNTTQSGWDDRYVRHPEIIESNGTYHMFYDGRPDGSGLLPHYIMKSTSTDLTSWTRNANRIIEGPTANSYYTDVSAVSVFEYNGKFHMLINAGQKATVNYLAGAKMVYANSDDLDSWDIITEKQPLFRQYENTGGIFNVQNLGEAEVYIQDSTVYVFGGRFVNGNIAIGRGTLQQGQHSEVLPRTLIKEPFLGSTINNSWQVDGDSNGISISQNDSLTITSDGTQNSSAIGVETVATYNDNYFTILVDTDRTNATGAITEWGMVDSADATNYFCLRGTTSTNIDYVISESGVEQSESITVSSYNGQWRMVWEAGELRIWSWSTAQSDWFWSGRLYSDLLDKDWKFYIKQSNVIGSAITFTVDNLGIVPYDYLKREVPDIAIPKTSLAFF